MAKYRLEELEEENEELRQRVAALEAVLAPGQHENRYRLTAFEARLLASLAKGGLRTFEHLYQIIYSGRLDPPDTKTLKAHVWKLRQKLIPFGLDVRTVWGQGYELPPASLAILNCPRDGHPRGQAIMDAPTVRVDEGQTRCSNSCSPSA